MEVVKWSMRYGTLEARGMMDESATRSEFRLLACSLRSLTNTTLCRQNATFTHMYLSVEQAPTDYLLYYKRATAYYSLGRHPAALADFDQVLALTNDTFDKANLMKARIYAKEGKFTEARDALRKYSTKVKGDQGSQEVMMSITEGELATKKVAQAIRAKLWSACVEAASMALSTASHSVKLRQQRADCSMAAGDIESAVADLSYVTAIPPPLTVLISNV